MIDGITAEKVYDFITVMDDNHRSYSCDDGFCFFLRLDDKTLEMVKSNPKILTDPQTIKDLLFCLGDNIHFLAAYGRKFKVIRQAIRAVIINEHPSSVSWFNKNMSKFIYRRVECHQ